MDSYTTLVKCSSSLSLDVVYLHSAAQAEDTVVCFLGLEALEGGLHNVVLLGEQVIGPVKQYTLAHSAMVPNICHYFSPNSATRCVACEGCVPQSKLPVSCGVAVPAGERLHPLLEPWALVDERGEGRRRHGCGDSTGLSGVEWVVGCLQLQNVEVVRSSSWSGERSELQLGEVRPPTSSDRRTWKASYSSAATSLSPPVTDFHSSSDVAITTLPAYPSTTPHHTPAHYIHPQRPKRTSHTCAHLSMEPDNS
jgi:hypothetical protein